jgi:predicted nucleotidyltransferase
MPTATEIQNLADEIAKGFRPERIILFGSHARGAPTRDSDVDLLVVMRAVGAPPRKSVAASARHSLST